MTLRTVRPLRRFPLLLALLAALITVATAPAAPAAAGIGTERTTARPVPADDDYRAYATGAYRFAVLENDDATFLSSGPVTLCGVSLGATARQSVYAEIDRDDPDLLYVQVDRDASGTVRFSYDACQGDQRATATVSLSITQLVSPTVERGRAPGRITATNPNAVPLMIQWGSNTSDEVDGRRQILPLRRVSITVQRTRVYWVAYLVDRGALIVAGEGTVAKIRRR